MRDVTLFETVRVMAGRAPLWPRHLARLRASAAVFGILPPPVNEPSWGGDDLVVRCELAGGSLRLVPREVPPAEPIMLATSPAPHRGYQHKVAERHWLEAARLSVAPLLADDALMFDPVGRLVEATIWAIGWWEGERLVFPPLGLGGLPSVARGRLAGMVRGGVAVAAIDREGLKGRSLLACNAARGVVPVAALDGQAVPPNLRTAALAARFWDGPQA